MRSAEAVPKRLRSQEGMTRRQVAGAMGILVGLLGFVACSSSSTEPSSVQPTLAVTNPLCDSLGCRPVVLRAFVWAFKIPQRADGAKKLAEIHGTGTCVLFPPFWRLVVSEVDLAGKVVKSDTTFWTPDDDDGIFLTITAAGGPLLASTGTFVPGEASGWELTFSQGSSQDPLPFSAHLSPGERCTPS